MLNADPFSWSLQTARDCGAMCVVRENSQHLEQPALYFLSLRYTTMWSWTYASNTRYCQKHDNFTIQYEPNKWLLPLYNYIKKKLYYFKIQYIHPNFYIYLLSSVYRDVLFVVHAYDEDRVVKVALSKDVKCNRTQITQSTSAVHWGPEWISNTMTVRSQ